MNLRLAALYGAVWPYFAAMIPIGEGYSNPLLLSATMNYVDASCRLMVVGQETHSWFGPFVPGPTRDRIAALQQSYKEFEFGRAYRKTPFWRAAHSLRERLVPGSDQDALVWSNLNAFDQFRGRAWRVERDLARLGILRQEVSLLRPDVLVFFTGPSYDALLHTQFPEIKFEPLATFNERELAYVRHPDLPRRAVRLYHPAYLQRTRRFDPVIGEVVRALESDRLA